MCERTVHVLKQADGACLSGHHDCVSLFQGVFRLIVMFAPAQAWTMSEFTIRGMACLVEVLEIAVREPHGMQGLNHDSRIAAYVTCRIG